jgi:hypothetical protein
VVLGDAAPPHFDWEIDPIFQKGDRKAKPKTLKSIVLPKG